MNGIMRCDKKYRWVLVATGLTACALDAAQLLPKGSEWEDCQALGLGKLPPRAWFGHFPDAEGAKRILMQESPWHRFLDGETEWRFNWCRKPADRPKDFFKMEYDVSNWDVVKVPCSWQAVGIRKSLERYGVPIYVNQSYAFNEGVPPKDDIAPKVTGAKIPSDWTFGPDDNPVGSYRRDFEVPESWGDKDVFLQFDGVESFFYLWVNGTYVGYSKNSRSPAAFDVTKLVRPGRNMVAVEVYRNSDGSYLEAQDMYRLSGIMRHVRLYCAPKSRIADARIVTTPCAQGVYDGDWKVNVKAEYAFPHPFTVSAENVSSAPVCTVRARVFDAMDREIALTGRTSGSTLHADNTPYWADNNFSLMPLEFTVTKPRRWSAEEPNLYTLVLELVDAGGAVIEAAGFQLGFREVEIRRASNPQDHVFLFNGRPIKVKGVNRGETDPKYGHYVPDEEVLQDLTLIKQANMNHIRCSHFPQGEYFYYLCNKFGIYVMDEANLESHGYFYAEKSLSHREEWLAAHWDRVRAMYEWDKNNPSVIFWSLGNEAGPGRAFKECYENLKGRDSTRPINWERNNSLVDIGSRQYPPVSWVRDVAAGTNTVMYPYHINEYAHDLCNGGSDLQAYQEAIESSDRIVGAAIWDWADQALLKKVEKTGGGGEKREVWFDAFGGDWDEKPVEAAGGDGILDGIVHADRTPEPQYFEAKHVFQPFRFKLKDGKVEVESKLFFVDSSAYDFMYRPLVRGVEVDGWRPFEIGAPLAPRETRLLDLPEGVADAVRFRVTVRKGKDLLPTGWPVAEDQLELVPFAPLLLEASPVCLEKRETADEIAFGPWRFSRKSGVLLNGGMTLDCFRHPVGDEVYSWTKPGPDAPYREWLKEGWRRMCPKLVRFSKVSELDDGWAFETEQLWRGEKREDITSVRHVKPVISTLGEVTATNAGFRVVTRWFVRTNGVVSLESQFEPFGRKIVPPRLGWRFVFSTICAASYYGRGPYDTYPTRKGGAFAAVWHVKNAFEMCSPYTRTQEMGCRESVRWIKLADPLFAVYATDVPFSLQLSPYSTTEVILNDHAAVLPTPTKTEVGIYLPQGVERLSVLLAQ